MSAMLLYGLHDSDCADRQAEAAGLFPLDSLLTQDRLTESKRHRQWPCPRRAWPWRAGNIAVHCFCDISLIIGGNIFAGAKCKKCPPIAVYFDFTAEQVVDGASARAYYFKQIDGPSRGMERLREAKRKLREFAPCFQFLERLTSRHDLPLCFTWPKMAAALKRANSGLRSAFRAERSLQIIGKS
jgi:hypothetical protein